MEYSEEELITQEMIMLKLMKKLENLENDYYIRKISKEKLNTCSKLLIQDINKINSWLGEAYFYNPNRIRVRGAIVEWILYNTDLIELMIIDGLDLSYSKQSKYLSRCPFCGEENGLIVSSKKMTYFCYTCNSAGRAINYLMKKYKLQYFDATEIISILFNIPYFEKGSSKDDNDEISFDSKNKNTILMQLLKKQNDTEVLNKISEYKAEKEKRIKNNEIMYISKLIKASDPFLSDNIDDELIYDNKTKNYWIHPFAGNVYKKKR